MIASGEIWRLRIKTIETSAGRVPNAAAVARFTVGCSVISFWSRLFITDLPHSSQLRGSTRWPVTDGYSIHGRGDLRSAQSTIVCRLAQMRIFSSIVQLDSLKQP